MLDIVQLLQAMHVCGTDEEEDCGDSARGLLINFVSECDLEKNGRVSLSVQFFFNFAPNVIRSAMIPANRSELANS